MTYRLDCSFCVLVLRARLTIISSSVLQIAKDIRLHFPVKRKWLSNSPLKRCLSIAVLVVLAGACACISAQQLAKRLILKDGSYQLVTKWEVHGDRVRYYSAERDSWEEVPKSLVDWAATNKFEKDWEAGVPPPEAIQLDKELEADHQVEEAKTPEVSPGLRLEDPNTAYLLDTFNNQPQLAQLQQNGGDINRDTKKNMLRAAINPVAGSKQTIELTGSHAGIQAHVTMPFLYVNAAQEAQNGDAKLPWDRFRIVRMEGKRDRRVLGDIKITIFGKTSQQQKLVPASSNQLTGGWVMISPNEPLARGEYALVEMLGKEGVNLYVWDFGVNPAAPANPSVVTPASSSTAPPTEPVPALQRPDNNN